MQFVVVAVQADQISIQLAATLTHARGCERARPPIAAAGVVAVVLAATFVDV